MEERMRAAVYDGYGPPDVLRVAEIARPVPGAGEALIRVEATTVNGGELPGRQGRLKLVTGRRFPQRVGIDFVGTVVGLGAGVEGLRPGDRVWGAVDEKRGRGAAADYVVVGADTIALAPSTLDPVEAASVLAGGAVGLEALAVRAGVRSGERVLIRGASGGVGSVAVQVATELGGEVTALASDAAAGFVRDLGAARVIDYRTPIADLEGYDVILDTRGTQMSQVRGLLTPTGRMVAIAFDLDHAARSLGYVLWSTVHGPQRVQFFFGALARERFATLARLVDQGKVRPVVAGVHPLEGIAEAHAQLEAGGVHGKVVIDLLAGT